MKTIGILNFHYSNSNYGAVLQAYALREYLMRKGYDVQIINFRNFPCRPILVVKTLCSMFAYNNPFETFRRKFLGINTLGYLWAWQLYFVRRQFDIYIVGSDQVWRASCAKFPSSAYFLSFVKKSKLKIAYAVSYGVNVWEHRSEEYTSEVRRLIAEFSSVSVREYSGIDICRSTFLKDAQLVLDPTLLVGAGYFDPLITHAVDRKKIVYYKLDKDEKFELLLNNIEECRNEKAFDFYYRKSNWGANKYYSIHEWLGYIKNADIVITDSYHCICFCILFKKLFLCYLNEERGVARFDSLFKLLSLEDRIYNGSNLEYLLNSVIDYDKMENQLSEMRKSSELFLTNALCGL